MTKEKTNRARLAHPRGALLGVGVAVEAEEVRSLARQALQHALVSHLDKLVADGLALEVALFGHENGAEAADVRSGHGGAGHAALLAVLDPGVDHHSGGVDVDALAVVGEAGLAVALYVILLACLSLSLSLSLVGDGRGHLRYR